MKRTNILKIVLPILGIIILLVDAMMVYPLLVVSGSSELWALPGLVISATLFCITIKPKKE